MMNKFIRLEDMKMDKQSSIWINERTHEIYVGKYPLFDLTPLQRSILLYFIKNPETYLTKTQLIENSWPDCSARNGVSDDALYQLIRSLRAKLKQFAPSNCQYIRTWRGIPEGGYRFLPNGTLQYQNA